MCSGIALRGKDPRVLGQRSRSHQWDRHGHSLFLLTPVRARGTSISLRVLYRSLLLHREAGVWVKAKDRAHGPKLPGSKGMSTPSHHRLSQLISRLYRVC